MSSQKLLFLQSLPDISVEYLVLLQKEISQDMARSCFPRGLTSLELSDLERSLWGQEFVMRFSSWHSFSIFPGYHINAPGNFTNS